MKRFGLTILFFVAIGCSPKIYPIESKDSVRVEIRERVVRDSVFVEIEKQTESVARDSTSHLENDYASSDASIIDGILYHSLFSKPQKIYVPYTVTVRDTIMMESSVRTEIKEVNVLTKWQKFWIETGKICLVSLVLLIVFFVLKTFIFKR